MPRKPRKKSPIDVYHVVVKGANGQLLFEELYDYVKYLEILEFYKKDCHFELYAYCLMSNHVHLLIRTNKIPLDAVFRKINTSYANWFNMKYNRSGPLQDGRFYSEPIDSYSYLLAAVRYIHRNPLSAGLEKKIGCEYPWNSYQFYVEQGDNIVNTDIVLSEFPSIDDFIAFHHVVSNYTFIDIDTIRKRLPDDVASIIIRETCKVNFSTDLVKLSMLERNKQIPVLYEKGISVRQLSRLTGIPRGVIDRIIARKVRCK